MIVDVNGNLEAISRSHARPRLSNALCDAKNNNGLGDAFQSLSDLCKNLNDICKNLSEHRKNVVSVGVGGTDSVQVADDILPFRSYQRSAPGVSEVLPHLLLGGAAALRPGLLDALGVTCVVNCTSELPDTPVPDDVAYLRVPLQDSTTAPLSQHLDTVADAIEEVRLRGGRTLVHCVAGVSRSAALVLGYLVKHRAMPLSDAFQLVRAARPAVRPNSGFFRQLIDWEERLLGSASVHMVHNPAVSAPIPDVYEADYKNTVSFHNKYSRNAARRT